VALWHGGNVRSHRDFRQGGYLKPPAAVFIAKIAAPGGTARPLNVRMKEGA